MKDRAHELYDFLCDFAISENILKISGEGGMTVVGWSLGGNWVTALLAYLEIFEGVEMALRSYLNKLILLGMQIFHSAPTSGLSAVLA